MQYKCEKCGNMGDAAGVCPKCQGNMVAMPEAPATPAAAPETQPADAPQA